LGDNSFYIAQQLKQDGKVISLDVSTKWQRVARNRLGKLTNVGFINMDLASSGLPDESFDVIVINYVLHDTDPSERQGIVQEWARKLKSSGFIQLKDPTKKLHGICRSEKYVS
jgi:ubiquinone/menaquinone biosynthesis C-methylase UbiE